MAFILGLALFVAAEQTPLGTQPSTEFGFRFRYTLCTASSFDTFTGAYTRELGGDPPQWATAILSLSDAEMRVIADALQAIDFFSYPSVFMPRVESRPGIVGAIVSPSDDYQMEVFRDGRAHAVSWRDRWRPSTQEADKLRAVFQRTIALIEGHPAVKQLPAIRVGCL